MTTGALLRLHRIMDNLLVVEVPLVFMTYKAKFFAGSGKPKRGLGSFEIMTDLTAGRPHRTVDILGLTHLRMAFI
jgi:hypothetical protein